MNTNKKISLEGDKILAEGVKIDREPVVKAHTTKNLQDVRQVNGNRKYFYGKTTKDPVSYTIGDKITFNIYLYVDNKVVSCPYFKWTILTDGGYSFNGTVSGEGGGFKLTIPATSIGFIRLKVSAADESKVDISGIEQGTSLNGPALFSAGVDIDKLTQEYAEPKDFDSFWASQIKTLDTVKPDVIEMVHWKDYNGYKYYKVKVKGTADTGFISGYLTYPIGAEKGSLGIDMVCFAYSSMDVYAHTSPNSAVFSISPHSIELQQSDDYYKALSNGALKNYGFINNQTIQDCDFRPMILRHLQALRFLKAYLGTEGVMVNGSKKALGLWNKNDIYVWGGSQGGYLSLAVAAFDHDVTKIVSESPWLCDIGGGDKSSKMESVFRPSYTSALSYIDGLNMAKRISTDTEIQIISGLGDYVCPPSGHAILYNILNKKHTVIWTLRQGHTHGYSPAKQETYTHSSKE